METAISAKTLLRQIAKSSIPVSIERYPDGTIVYLNAAMRVLMDYKADAGHERGKTSTELGWWTHPLERGRLIAVFNATLRLDEEFAHIRTAHGRERKAAVSMRLVTWNGQRFTIAAFVLAHSDRSEMRSLLDACETIAAERIQRGVLEYEWLPNTRQVRIRGMVVGLIDTLGESQLVSLRTAARCFSLRDWTALVALARKSIKQQRSASMKLRVLIDDDPHSQHFLVMAPRHSSARHEPTVAGYIEPVRSRAQVMGYSLNQNPNLELASDAAGVSTWEIFADGSVIWDGSTFLQYGYPAGSYEKPESVFRRAFTDREFERLSNWVKLNFLQPNVQSIEYEIRLPDGRTRWISARATQRRDQSGRVTSIAGINWDITAQKTAQSRLEEQREELVRLSNRLFDQERALGQQMSLQLHDGLGQTLVAMSIQVHLLMDQLSSASISRETVTRISELSEQALREVRTVLSDIRPVLLEKHGLVPALRHECKALVARFGHQQVELVFDTPLSTDPPPQLDGRVEYSLFMIAREAVINSLKHSGLKTLRVSVRYSSSLSCELFIQDDGIGMQRNINLTDGSGVGLTSMRERASAIGADIAFLPADEGTCLRVSWTSPG